MKLTNESGKFVSPLSNSCTKSTGGFRRCIA